MLRRVWNGSSIEHLLSSQKVLLDRFVITPFHAKTKVLNAVDTWDSSSGSGKKGKTVVLTHGYGSGLGFFFSNFDDVASFPGVDRVVAVDWLGMGGSPRPNTCTSAVRVPLLFDCDSKYEATGAIDFFIDSLEQWRISNEIDEFVLIGHSLGGYLSARYAMKYNQHVESLILISPVGFPEPEPMEEFLKLDEAENSSNYNGLQLVDALWRKNFTPQSLIRLMGPRGLESVSKIIKRRFGNRWSDQDNDLIASYLYHITVAKPSGEYALNSILRPVFGSSSPGVFARQPLIHDFNKITAKKVRVLYGDHDWLRNNTEAAKIAVSNCQGKGDVITIPNSGHHLYLDNPLYFKKALEDIITT